MSKVSVVNVVTEKQINKIIEERQPLGFFWTIDKTGKYKAVKNLKNRTSIASFEQLNKCVG